MRGRRTTPWVPAAPAASGVTALVATAAHYLWILNVTLSLPLMVLSLSTLYWTTYAWHSPEIHRATTRTAGASGPTTGSTFSIIIPLRNEPYPVVAATVARLLAQTHRLIQPVLSVGYDDADTLEVARRLVAEHPESAITLAVSYSDVHNKPTQLNAALPHCAGDIVGILDAESLSAPELLAQVDSIFALDGTDVVQGGVMIVNHRSSWVALRSTLEYYVNHRSKMHFAAERRFMLMGGNTVFFRRQLLEEIGGWDAGNLAEDAEMGVRLSVLGHEVRVAYHPQLVSREEAPTTVRAWTRQRTRWNLGFMQTSRKGEWRKLPTRRRRILALWLLWQPAIIAVTGIVIPAGILVALVSHAPLWATMISFLPAIPTVLLVVMDVTMLSLYGAEIGVPVLRRDYVKLLVTTPLYQLMCAFAAARAAARLIRGDLRWEKTVHPGTHLAAERTRALGSPSA